MRQPRSRPPASPDPTAITFTRRALFVGATASAVAASATVLALRVAPDAEDELEPIRRIGRAYLDQVPEESSRTELTSVLGLGGMVISVESVFDRVDAIDADFARRETVVLDGWTLSLTEARAAALLYLTT